MQRGQVVFSPTGDHYRTRLTHTLEVSQIARTIAKVLHLHEELTEAITHLAFYAGWPNVFSAMPIAKDVFEKRGR